MFQEIRMPRKSLREVLPKKGAAVSRAKAVKEELEEEPQEDYRPVAPRPRRSRGGGGRKLALVLIAAIVIIASGFLISKSFATAWVELTPKTMEVALNGGDFTVSYESVVIPAVSESKIVAASVQTGAPKKASGTITIANEFGPNPQTLVATTRFETADGKIYRIDKAVTVPGAKTVGGKLVPGTVEAVVTADKAGADYNIASATFTIPGFKGDPRFDKFSAKTKTAISGGSTGQGLVANEAVRGKVVAELKASLLKQAAEQIRFQIPEDFILYENAIIADWKETLTPVAGKTNEATLTLSASPRAIIFNRDLLGKALASSVLAEGERASFEVANLDKLAVTIDQASLVEEKKEAKVSAQGTAQVVLGVETANLKEQLAGKDSAEAKEIFRAFPSISEAKVSFRPPWIREFPKKADRIKVEIKES